jgi:phospholipid/cholesterol/gamma-HCH transport system substrate-binding protein
MSVTSTSRRAVHGIVGTLAIVLVVLASLNFNRLPLVGNDDVVHAAFAEAGGLKGGDDVLVSGARVGKVREVRLEGDRVVADMVLGEGAPDLGDLTEARIVTVTLLGRAAVELEPEGTGALEPGDTIPAERTSSPYNLTATLDELTMTTAGIDKEQLAEALDKASLAFADTGEHVGPALRGLTRLSDTIAQNDDQLRSLLDRADRVTDLLAGRDRQIASLLGSGRSLLAELDSRQQVVISLLHSAQELSRQLRGVLHENRATVGPALDQLDRVVTLLNRNRTQLQESITGLRGYATAFNEAISSGPWFDAYIQNLTSPGTLAPILSGVTQ